MTLQITRCNSSHCDNHVYRTSHSSGKLPELISNLISTFCSCSALSLFHSTVKYVAQVNSRMWINIRETSDHCHCHRASLPSSLLLSCFITDIVVAVVVRVVLPWHWLLRASLRRRCGCRHRRDATEALVITSSTSSLYVATGVPRRRGSVTLGAHVAWPCCRCL